MKRQPFTLNRRTFLTGLGGTIVTLPILECMLDGHGEVFAQSGEAIPKRYVVCFGGHSMGADNDTVHNMYVPDTVGANYDLKLALEPLGTHGVQQDVTVVSGLEIDWAARNGGTPPPGGRHDGFHLASMSPLLSGVRSMPDLGSRFTVRGITSDQVVAQAIGQDTIHPSLQYRVQASWYLDQSAPYGRDIISYRGEADPIDATVSPQQAFNSLFQGFTPPDPGDAAERDFLLRSRKSVLDLVRQSYETLHPKLGQADRIRIQRHFEEIRALEERVAAIPPEAEGICMVPMDPGMDPMVGGNNSVNGGDGFDVNAGYSMEHERAQVFTDLVHMALACDLTRVVAMQYTMAQSHMNMFPLIQIPFDLHEIGHSSPERTTGVSQAIRWHVDHWAQLVKKLSDTQEGTGDMLDNTVVIYLNEGGHGYDPEGVKDNSAHSTERMAMMVAGRVGGLNPGRHIATNGAHPAQVLISAMQAVGVQTDTLGEVTGNLPELFT